MAIVNISLDTKTRQTVLAIDGLMVSNTDFSVGKYTTFDGQEEVRFSYTIETVNDEGLSERHQFFLPSLEDIAVQAFNKLNKEGLASKKVHNDEKAKTDIVNFLKNINK